MALNLADRLLTIAVTATLTSAAWIVLGSGYLERVAPASEPSPTEPAAAQTTAAVRDGQAEVLLIPVLGVAAAQLTDSFADPRLDADQLTDSPADEPGQLPDYAAGEQGRLHEAIDIMAPAGTVVVAAASGTVERLFQSQAGGNTVYVRSDDRRTIHFYAHLQGYAAGLAEGQRVARGQPLGTVGSSGNADPAAPHLHFAVLRTTPDAEWWGPATAVNPYPLLTGR